MSTLIQQLLGGVLESAYTATGTINTSNAVGAAEQIGAKLLIVKGISQDLGESAAVSFLASADTVLGPIAQQVVDALNGHEANLPAVVLGLIEAQSASATGAAA